LTGVSVGFNQMGFISTLKETPTPLVPAVVADGVGSLKPAKGLRQISPGSLNHQMVMVGHKAVAVEHDSKLFNHLFQGLQENLTVFVNTKYFFAFVASGNNVINRVPKFYAYRPCHKFQSLHPHIPKSSNVKS